MMPDPLDPLSDTYENPATSRDTSPDPAATRENTQKVPIHNANTNIATEAPRTGKRGSEELLHHKMVSGAFLTAGQQFSAPSSGHHMHALLAPRIPSFPTNPLETEEVPPPRRTVDEPSSDEFARMSRSERKKYREKKRRSDVNKGFDELMALLMMVDPGLKAEVEEQEKAKKHQNKVSNSTDGDNHVLNRVDLIGRTTMALERMYRQNQEQKALIAELSQGTGGDVDAAAAARQAIKDNRVLMMIPFLAPLGPPNPGPGAHGSNLASHHIHPRMHAPPRHVEGGASFQNQMAFDQQTAYQQQHHQSAQMRGYGPLPQQGFRNDQASTPRYFHNMHETNATAMSGMAQQESMGQHHGRMM